MKLFATWEIEKSSPNCIPRLCSLTLTRLVVLKPLENDLASVTIAVKMQSSKRILRSNEIPMPLCGTLDVELDLSFSLQYPHFLKRDGNKLQVMIQRRKRYKNRTILGYKTLAIGHINMTQVLQRSVDRELNLYSDLKERTADMVAKVTMLSLTSQPVDHEENGRQKLPTAEADRSPDVELSDDDQDDQEDWTDKSDMSDSEPALEEDTRRSRKANRAFTRPNIAHTRQRNIKQKFIALLKRFKVTEEVLDSEQDQDLGDQEARQQSIEDLIDELEDLSDSGPEMDNISVLSTPKPKLRPFFTGKSSVIDIIQKPKETTSRYSDDSSKKNDSDSHLDPMSEQELSDSQIYSSTPPVEDVNWFPRSPVTSSRSKIDRSSSLKEKSNKREQVERRNSNCTENGADGYMSEPHIVVLDQLGTVLSSEESLPDNLILVNTNEWQGQVLAQVLQKPQFNVVCTSSSADVKAAIAVVVGKIQKFCNSNSQAPAPIKVAIAGGDAYLNSVLRPYVEQFSAKSHDWQRYLQFLYIPLGSSSIGKYLGILDSSYNVTFMDPIWKDAFDKTEYSRSDMSEIVNRISRYIKNANSIVQLPIAEAMVTCKDKSSEEESSQIFVPFINEVRIGPIDVFGAGFPSTSVDLEDIALPSPGGLSSSPPSTQIGLDKVKAENHTPPSSPNVNSPVSASGSTVTSPASSSPPEFMDLQVDYWTVTCKPELAERDRLQKKDSKASLKTTFKSVQVFRLPQAVNGGENGPNTLSMNVVMKEKKQKIMRIGKKSKEGESKSQMIDGINRLVCTSKSHINPLTVTIDSVEWAGVKFFQVSSLWQTHIKHFPILVFGHIESLS